MANGKTLRQLIKAGASGDVVEFRRASEAVITQERQKQHHLLANDLEQILYADHLKAPSRRNGISQLLDAVPVDKERGLPLLDIKQPQRHLEELVIKPEPFAVIEDLLEEHRREDVLHSYGIKASGKVLFFSIRAAVKRWLLK